jgi:ribosomal protein S18 acetylase RimI-like enzyme
MGMKIRDGVGQDFEPLCRIYEQATGQRETAVRLTELYLDHYFVKLVQHDKDIIGLLVWFPREDPKLGWAEILDVWIHDDHRRRGLGSELLGQAVAGIKRYFRSQGCSARCIILFTAEGNEAARGLYEKAGFRRIGYGGYVSEDGTRELIYALNF